MDKEGCTGITIIERDNDSVNDTILYYAYGSNLHPERLGARIPSSQFLCVSSLTGYQLCFHKRGEDFSAKCNAAFSGNEEHLLLGAVFRMLRSEKPILDEIEGEGYVVHSAEVQVNGSLQEVFMYVAETPYIDESIKPFKWYKDFVHLGAQFHISLNITCRQSAASKLLMITIKFVINVMSKC